MKTETEIKSELLKIIDLEEKRGNTKENHMGPRMQGKARALKWVLEQVKGSLIWDLKRKRPRIPRKDAWDKHREQLFSKYEGK